MDIKESELEAVLTAMLNGATADRQARFDLLKDKQMVQNGLAAIAARRPDEFRLMVQYPLDDTVHAIVMNALPSVSNEVRFLFCEAGFVERQIRALIEQVEGSACCADKTRTVLRAMARALIDGKTIEFNYEQEYTYHLPKMVLNSHESIVVFFRAVYQLFYGKPVAYLQFLSTLVPRNAAEGAGPGT